MGFWLPTSYILAVNENEEFQTYPDNSSVLLSLTCYKVKKKNRVELGALSFTGVQTRLQLSSKKPQRL